MKVGGRVLNLTMDEVLRKMEGQEPEPIREHLVEMLGTVFPPKQVLATVTGWDRQSFTTMEAQRVLQRIGFTCRRAGQRPDGQQVRASHDAIHMSLSEGDREAIAARLRHTRSIEQQNARDFGRRIGASWARETATLGELELLYRVTSRKEWLVSLPDGHSAAAAIWEARDPNRDSRPDDFQRLDPESPFDTGFVAGARDVYDQVRDLL
jgi:hypothetical protein